MKITVTDDDGTECFIYDTDKNSMCLCPGCEDKPEVIAALKEATKFLANPGPVRLWKE